MLSKLIGLTIAFTMIALVTTVHAAQPQTDAANAAVQYIESLQNADGGFPAFGSESTPGSTLDAAFALIAAGKDLSEVRLNNSPANTSVADYLVGRIFVYTADDPGAAAKMALGLADIAAAGDLVPNGYYDGDTGAYGDDLYDEAFYILALVQTQHPVPTLASTYLLSLQQPDGGWEFAQGFGSDTNTTAMVAQALIAAGMASSDAVISDALTYLASAQNDDGGFGFLAGAESDPNSTALVIQALVAVGEDIDRDGPWEQSGNTPMDALLSVYNPATGAFQYAGEDSPFATYQAVPALMLAPFPDLQTRVEVEPTPAATSIATSAPPTPTLQPVLPSAGRAGPANDTRSTWVIAALVGVAGTIVLGAAFVSRRRH